MANTFWLTVLCIPTLIAVAWVHYRLRTHRLNTRWTAGAVLFMTGLAFGWTMAFAYTQAEGLPRLLVFLSSFGLVHVPAAFFLQLKHWQRSESD